jgi:hypothetical protein
MLVVIGVKEIQPRPAENLSRAVSCQEFYSGRIDGKNRIIRKHQNPVN